MSWVICLSLPMPSCEVHAFISMCLTLRIKSYNGLKLPNFLTQFPNDKVRHASFMPGS